MFGRPKSTKPKAEKEKEYALQFPRPGPSGTAVSTRRSRRHVKKRRRARGDERIYADEVSASSEDEWDLGMKHFNDSSTIDWVTAATGCELLSHHLFFSLHHGWMSYIVYRIHRDNCASPQLQKGSMVLTEFQMNDTEETMLLPAPHSARLDFNNICHQLYRPASVTTAIH